MSYPRRSQPPEPKLFMGDARAELSRIAARLTCLSASGDPAFDRAIADARSSVELAHRRAQSIRDEAAEADHA